MLKKMPQYQKELSKVGAKVTTQQRSWNTEYVYLIIQNCGHI